MSKQYDEWERMEFTLYLSGANKDVCVAAPSVRDAVELIKDLYGCTQEQIQLWS